MSPFASPMKICVLHADIAIAVISEPVALRIGIISFNSPTSAASTLPSRKPANNASSPGKAVTHVTSSLLLLATQIGFLSMGPNLPSNGQQTAS